MSGYNHNPPTQLQYQVEDFALIFGSVVLAHQNFTWCQNYFQQAFWSTIFTVFNEMFISKHLNKTVVTE